MGAAIIGIGAAMVVIGMGAAMVVIGMGAEMEPVIGAPIIGAPIIGAEGNIAQRCTSYKS
jgi:hypothetical protein